MGDAVTNALGGYTWIDNVLLDGLDYFSGLFYFFQHWSLRIASFILLIGLLISAIKLLFGAEAIKKAAIGTLGKLLVFFLIFNFYNSIVATVANTALSWGSRSGGGRRTVTHNLVTLMEQTKNDLAVAEMLSKIENPKEREKKLQQMKTSFYKNKSKRGMGKGTNNLLVSNLVSADGVQNFQNQVYLYKGDDLENVITSQLKTLKTLEGVLVPGKVKDKNGNLIDTYFLNTTLVDKKGNSTYYISPASFLKVSILTGNLLWKRQADYCEVKYHETKEKVEKRGDLVKFPTIEAFFETYSFSELANFLLCFICQIAIFLCAIMVLMQYIMTFFEYAIVTSIVIFYTPFYLADITKQITSKMFPIFWHFFIKIMVITICMWFSLYIYINLASDQMGAATPFDATTFCATMFSILLSFVVTQSSPKISQTIISGNPELSMGELLMGAATMYGAGKIGQSAMRQGGLIGARALGEGHGRGKMTAANLKERVKSSGGGRIAQAFAGAAGYVGGAAVGGVKGGVTGVGSRASSFAGSVLFGKNNKEQSVGATFKGSMVKGVEGSIKAHQRNQNIANAIHDKLDNSNKSTTSSPSIEPGKTVPNTAGSRLKNNQVQKFNNQHKNKKRGKNNSIK